MKYIAIFLITFSSNLVYGCTCEFGCLKHYNAIVAVVEVLARAGEVTPARINEIARERRGITADTALRIARFLGTDVQSWINLQAHYDIECAQAAVGRSLTRIKPLQRPRESA